MSPNRYRSEIPADSVRCWYQYASGRRCRQTISAPGSQFCTNHVPRAERDPEVVALTAELAVAPDELLCAGNIHHALARLFSLLARNRISSRRAAVLTYIAQTLLRTLPALQAEMGPERVEVIVDTPRPKREPAFVEASP
jgi:hypothetical protein